MLLNIVADAQIELLRLSVLRQIVGAGGVAGVDIMQIHLIVVQPLAQRTVHVRLVHLLLGFPHAAEDRAWRILLRRDEVVTLDADNVRDQHSVARDSVITGRCSRSRSSQASPIAQIKLLAYSFRPWLTEQSDCERVPL